MHKPGNEVSFWSAVAMGIGAMAGARLAPLERRGIRRLVSGAN